MYTVRIIDKHNRERVFRNLSEFSARHKYEAAKRPGGKNHSGQLEKDGTFLRSFVTGEVEEISLHDFSWNA